MNKMIVNQTSKILFDINSSKYSHHFTFKMFLYVPY